VHLPFCSQQIKTTNFCMPSTMLKLLSIFLLISRLALNSGEPLLQFGTMPIEPLIADIDDRDRPFKDARIVVDLSTSPEMIQIKNVSTTVLNVLQKDGDGKRDPKYAVVTVSAATRVEKDEGTVYAIIFYMGRIKCYVRLIFLISIYSITKPSLSKRC